MGSNPSPACHGGLRSPLTSQCSLDLSLALKNISVQNSHRILAKLCVANPMRSPRKQKDWCKNLHALFIALFISHHCNIHIQIVLQSCWFSFPKWCTTNLHFLLSHSSPNNATLWYLFLLARKSHRIGCQVKFSGDESRWGAELLQVTLGYIFVQFLTDNIRRKAILLKSSSLNPPCRVLIKSKNKASSRKIGLFFVNGFSSHRGVDKMQGFQWNHARCLDLQLAPTAYPSSFPPTLGAFLLHCADTNPYPKSPSCSSSIPGERLRGAVGEVTGSIPMLLLFYTCNGERTHGLLKCSTENLSNALPEGSCKVSLYLGD